MALPIASAAIVANGLQGTYLHARGIAQKPGGWSNARYNLEMGPPLLAPLLASIVACMGCSRRSCGGRRAGRPAPGLLVPLDNRFPGFDVPGQVRRGSGHRGSGAVQDRGRRRAKFFTPAEQTCAGALLDLLLDQPSVPVLAMIDARLAAGETDGWRYADMAEDGQAWRDTLAYLDGDAHERFVTSFAGASREEQAELVQAVQDADSWHGIPAGHVWSLWTRYACTAFYSHPAAWAEIGFPGPADPRGYKNAGVDSREPFEVARRAARDRPGPEGRLMASVRARNESAWLLPNDGTRTNHGCARTCGGSPTTTSWTWSSWAAARAVRSCCSGWPGRAGRWRPSMPGRSGIRTPTG